MKRIFSLLIFALLFNLSEVVFAVTTDIAELKAKIEQYEANEEYANMAIASLELQELAHSQGDIAEEVLAFRSLGEAYYWLGANEEALRAYESSVKLFDPSLDPAIRASFYIAMSKLLTNVGKNEESLKFTTTGISFAEDLGNTEFLAHLYFLRGAALIRLGKYDAAQKALERAITYLGPNENEHLYGKIHNNMGMIYKFRDEYELALSEFGDLLVQAKRRNNNELIVYSFLELGDINRILGRYEIARGFLDQALSISNDTEVTLWKSYSHSYLAALDKETGDHEAANNHTQQVKLLEQQMFNDKVSNGAELLKVNVAIMERENSIALLEKDKEIQAIELDRRQTLILFIGIGALLIAIALWVTYWLYIQKNRANRELIDANAKLDEIAATDHLTGLPNRRSMLEQVNLNEDNRRVESCETALIMVDLDHFKMVNDQHGHDHGDAVLVEVSQRLKDNLRGTDTVARWGGEEFLVLLPQTNTEQAHSVAETLRQKIADSAIEFKGTQHQITATLGLATYNGEDTFEQTLRHADDALYQGKETGRNRVVLVNSIID